MDFIRTKNAGGPMDVIFDGRFIFIEKFHGLIAIALPKYDKKLELIGYQIERTLEISPQTIQRVITNYLNGVRSSYNSEPFKLTFEDSKVHQYVGSLSYGIELNICPK